MRSLAPLAVAVLALTGCGSGHGNGGFFAASVTAPVTSAAPVVSATAPAPVVLQLGAALAAPARARVEALVRKGTTRVVEVRAPADPLASLAPGTLVLAIGDTTGVRKLIAAAETAALPGDGFLLRARDLQGITFVAADGATGADPFKLQVNSGLLYGAYAALEELGFAFLHPLAPTIPAALAAPALPLDRREAPRWAVRGIHLHTMHPLELTELLNGWGKNGPADLAGFQAMLPEWELFLEWCAANRQNRVEWFLLAADSWRAFAGSAERQRRLSELVSRAHAWGVAAGADAPLALEQQHAWRIIEKRGTLAQETAQIQARLAWLAGCGFDFLSTELGTSEFTSTDDVKMLAWLDAYAAAAKALGKRSYSKIHCSVGQTAKSFKDPITGGALNYNHLPRLADPSLGVMPHTVQHYGLDDPAPTYGNTDFAYVRRFLAEEAGTRETLWHPESAYWVSFDVDVPLFLPVYAERRVHDLRLLAGDEDAGRMGRGAHKGARFDGQMLFSSGWEWGYWLNDVVAARSAWNPGVSAASDDDALRAVLAPLARALGPAGARVRELVVETARAQRELLIEGRVNGKLPAKVAKRNGQAYLQGWETWDDVSVDLGKIPGLGAHPTQPEKLGLVELRNGFGPDYRAEVQPLLAALSARFAAIAAAFDQERARATTSGRPLLDDLADAARVTALRAEQVHGLYDFTDLHSRGVQGFRPRLDQARAALDRTQALVLAREKAYRVPADRIAGWRENPTSYPYAYLWSVRSLHYWWRDEAKAVDAPWSPFYMNVIDPLDVAFGEGFWTPLAAGARAWGAKHGLSSITNALAAPPVEPKYPEGGLRNRP